MVRYHNYAQWLANWTDTQKPVSTKQANRPLPLGSFNDNTTVQGSWIYNQDMKENSDIFKRIVNNVSMAMPHTGVYAAATEDRNNVVQPQDLDVRRTPFSYLFMFNNFFRDLANTHLKLRCLHLQ